MLHIQTKKCPGQCSKIYSKCIFWISASESLLSVWHFYLRSLPTLMLTRQIKAMPSICNDICSIWKCYPEKYISLWLTLSYKIKVYCYLLNSSFNFRFCNCRQKLKHISITVILFHLCSHNVTYEAFSFGYTLISGFNKNHSIKGLTLNAWDFLKKVLE